MTEQTPAGFDMLPSPYFFVPIDEEVWIPKEPVPSHDRPVKDGLSGHLRITLTAKTPIFIRAAGEHPKDPQAKKASPAYQSFYSLPDGTAAIPATSFNGMLRSVFEIITFSKLTPVPDEPMSIAGRQGRTPLGPMDKGRSNAHQVRHPERLDVAERVFGTVVDQFGLRKRVTATPLRCTSQPTPITDRGQGLRTVVGTPRATFYPHYVAQPGASRARIKGHSHATSNTKDFRVSGWKRYAVSPVPDDGIPLIPPPNNNEDICTWFRPLPIGTAFTGDLHFHNLRPWEFGALLWALTFGGRDDLCHSIGFGKPIGLGAVQLRIDWQQSTVLNAHSKPANANDRWFAIYEEALAQGGILQPGQELAQQPAIRDLLLLADLHRGDTAANVLRYPNDVKHFAKAKQQRLCLPRYHELFPDQAKGSPARAAAARPAQARPNPAHQGYTQIISPKQATISLPASKPPKPTVTIQLMEMNAKGKFKARQIGVGVAATAHGTVVDPKPAALAPGQVWSAELISSSPNNQNYRIIEPLR